MIGDIQRATGHGIRPICALLRVPRSSYYHATAPTPTQLSDHETGEIIEAVFKHHRSRHGYRRIWQELHEVSAKSWTSTHQAKQSHAILECLAHNLLLLFEQYLGHSEGLRDELEDKKQSARSKAAEPASVAAGIIRAVGNFINTTLQKTTPPTQRFIRWSAVWIYKQALLDDSLVRLKEARGGNCS